MRGTGTVANLAVASYLAKYATKGAEPAGHAGKTPANHPQQLDNLSPWDVFAAAPRSASTGFVMTTGL